MKASTATTRCLASLLALSAAAVYLRVLHLAGWSFPVPWNDESWVLWKVFDLARQQSVVTPRLNADLPLFTFPGYEAAMALVFRVFDFSLAGARLVSALAVVAGFLVLATVLVLRGRQPLGQVFIGALFLFGGPMVAVGNLARPESLLVFVILASAAAAAAARPAWALLGCAVAPMIHLNGVYTSALMLLSLALSNGLRWRPARADLLPLGLLVCACAAFLAYFLPRAEPFLEQIKFVAASMLREGNQESRWAVSVAFIVLAAAVWARLQFVRSPLSALASLMPALLLIPLGRDGQWYDIYECLGLALLGILALEVPGSRPDHGPAPVGPRLWRGALAGLALLAAVTQGYRLGAVEGPRNYLADLQWHGMRIRAEPAYITDADVQAVAARVMELAGTNGTVRVAFASDADGLFFHEALGNRCLIYHPVLTRTPPDIMVMHESAHHPAWWADFYFRPRRILYGIGDESLARVRDGTERWFVKDVRAINARMDPMVEWPLEVFWYRYRAAFEAADSGQGNQTQETGTWL